MKKTLVILAFLIILSLLISGCEDQAEDTEEDEADDTAQADEETNQTEETTDTVEDEEEEIEPEGFSDEEYTLSYTLADLETVIQSMDYLIGTNAPSRDVMIVMDIKNTYIRRDIDTGDAKLTGEVDDYKEDFIIIGSPCDNPAAASLFAKEIEEKENCNIFPEGEALILLKAVTNNDVILYVGGNTPDETALAAEVIKYPNQHDLSGTEIKVTGTVDEPVISIVN